MDCCPNPWNILLRQMYILHLPQTRGWISSSIMQAGCPLTQGVSVHPNAVSEVSSQVSYILHSLSASLYVYHVALSPYMIKSACKEQRNILGWAADCVRHEDAESLI